MSCESHTSNVQRAQTERPALCIVRSGTPIGRPPEGRSLRDAPSVNGTQKQNAFSARQRYFASQRLFFAYFFLTSQKKVCRRRPFPMQEKSGVETASTDAFRIGAKYASFGGKKKGPSFSGETPCFRATPHNSASRFGERFFAKPRFEKRRNTLCISNFSNRRIGGKDPSKREDAIARCCLRTQTLNRKFTTSPSCMTYSLPSLRSRPFALA